MSVKTSQAGRLYWNQKNEPNQALEILFAKALPISILAPWNFWLQYLTLAFKDGAGKRFGQIQKLGQGLCGFIVGQWDKEEKLTGYLSSYSRFGGFFREFDDSDTEAMRPLIYKTLHGAMNTIRKLPEGVDCEGEKVLQEELVGLAFWSHPEATDTRLEEYLHLSEGHRFPGSPRH